MDFGFGRALCTLMCAAVLLPHAHAVPRPERDVRTVVVASRLSASEDRVLQLLAQRRGGALPLDLTYDMAADQRAAQIVSSFCHCARPDVPALDTWGEVLAWHAGIDPEWVVDAWMASPTHRQVILMSRWDRVGIGSVLSGGRWYVVVLFGN